MFPPFILKYTNYCLEGMFPFIFIAKKEITSEAPIVAPAGPQL
jgi:hypothetical protein